ncbi:MAG: HPr family phosphocarrier protein, partial [Lachnospiraceae bacterium]
MSKIKVRFRNPKEVLDFVNTVGKYSYNMDMKRGRFIVDAKSILGIMNLGFDNDIELKVHEEECEDLLREIEPYVA